MLLGRGLHAADTETLAEQIVVTDLRELLVGRVEVHRERKRGARSGTIAPEVGPGARKSERNANCR